MPRHPRTVNASSVQEEQSHHSEEDEDEEVRPSKIPSLGELDVVLKRHRKQRKHRYSELTQCGPCCPCYYCTHPLRQNDDATFWPEDDAEEATDNVALLFSHMRRNHHDSLPDHPILVGVPKFVRDFREAMDEARQQTMTDAFFDAFLNLFQAVGRILLKMLTFIVLLPLVPFRVIRRRRRNRINNVDSDEELTENNEIESDQI